MTPAPFPSVLNGRPLIGWQTLLADLSLILFMVTAAAMSAGPGPARQGRPPPAVAAPVEAPRAEPIAVWRAGGDAPGLGRWLRDQAADPRQQLTITVRYPGPAADVPAAVARAAALASEAGAEGVAARVLVEPGGDEVVATLGYDRFATRAPGLVASGTGIAGKGR